MNDISNQLKSLLYKNGASLVGFANLNSVVSDDMPLGVSVALAIPVDIVKSIHDGPNADYYNTYYKLNKELDSLVTMGEEFLKEHGFKAYAQTTYRVIESDDYRTAIPHKTVATNAGLGWIGKSALLVTEEFGSAVRISSLITNAALKYAIPITASKCGDCRECKNACPAKAISGIPWKLGLDRDEFYNPVVCRKKARELSRERMQKEITLCGKCIEICPYTQRYVNRIK